MSIHIYLKQVCDYFDDEYGDQPDLTLGSLHETDSNYTGTPATDMMPIFPSTSSPVHYQEANVTDYSVSNADVQCSEVSNAGDDLVTYNQLSNEIESSDIVKKCEIIENNLANATNAVNIKEGDDVQNIFTAENTGQKIR